MTLLTRSDRWKTILFGHIVLKKKTKLKSSRGTTCWGFLNVKDASWVGWVLQSRALQRLGRYTSLKRSHLVRDHRIVGALRMPRIHKCILKILWTKDSFFGRIRRILDIGTVRQRDSIMRHPWNAAVTYLVLVCQCLFLICVIENHVHDT